MPLKIKRIFSLGEDLWGRGRLYNVEAEANLLRKCGNRKNVGDCYKLNNLLSVLHKVIVCWWKRGKETVHLGNYPVSTDI